MPKNEVVIRISGDNKEAVNAVNGLIKLLDRLPALVSKISASTQAMAKTADASLGKVNQRSQALNKTLSETSTKMAAANRAAKGADQGASSLAASGKKAADGVASIGKTITILERVNGKYREVAMSAQRLAAVQQSIAASSKTWGGGSIGGMGGPVRAFPDETFGKQVRASIQHVVQLSAKVSAFAGVAAGAFGKAASSVMQFTNNLRTGALSALNGIQRPFQNLFSDLGKSISSIRAYGIVVTDSFRLVTQGLTNIARSFTFFISLPMAAFFGTLVRGAVDFEDALVRVGKTTGLWGDKLLKLRESLREIGRWTSTSYVDLATIAEQIGQLGVTSENAIVRLTDLFNQMAVTTDLTAEDVAINMGKIANAFEWGLNTEEGVKNLERLGNVINELENQTASSANEIVTSLFKFAQSAQQVGISAAEATALSAAINSMGFSASEAGVGLKNLTLYMIKNSDVVSAAMKNTERYSTQQKVLNEINRDAVDVLLDIGEAASRSEEKAQTFLKLMEIGNLRGGRALAALANNVDLVRQYLSVANKEWQNQTSLWVEYQRALTSTKAQMGILKNNVTDLGITVGDILLPKINLLIQILVPALQEAGAWFKALDEKTQLWAIAIAMAAIAAAPLMFFLEQILHGVALISLGFSQLLKIIPMLLSSISSLIPLVMSVGRFFLGWPGLIIAGIVGVLKVLSMLGVDIAGFFQNLADRAIAWGERLAASYADGFIGGALRWIVAAMKWVANLIASFFQGHSPPKQGPLSTIDKWGKGVMDSYLKGFYLADFDILNGIGRIIERILTMGADEKQMPGALKKLAGAREAMAKLIDIFNKTGEISKSLISKITSGLGDMGGKVSNLITLWLQYNKIQRDLEDLEKRRKQVTKNYEKEIDLIGNSNMSLEEKVAAIREAQFARDEELRSIDKEQEGLEEQKDTVGEQLKLQQAIIDTLTDQQDIFARIADGMKKMAEEVGQGVADAIGGAFEGLGDANPIEEAQNAINDLATQVEDVKKRFSGGKSLFNALVAGFKGEARANLTGMDQDIRGLYEKLYQIGEQARVVYDKIMLWKDGIIAAKDRIVEFINQAKNIEINLKINMPSTNIGGFFKGFKEGFLKSFVAIVGPTWKVLVDNATKFWDALVKLWDAASKVFTFLGSPQGKGVMEVLGAILGFVAGLILGIFVGALNLLATLFLFIGRQIINLNTVMANFWAWLLPIIGEHLPAFIEGLKKGFADLPGAVSTTLAGFAGTVSQKFEEVRAAIALKWLEVWNDVTTWWTSIKENVAYWIMFIVANIVVWAIDTYTKVTEWWQNAYDAIEAKLAEIIGNVEQKIKDIIAKFTAESVITSLYNAGSAIIQGVWDGMKAKWAEVIAWAKRVLDSLPDAIKDLLDINSPSKVMIPIGVGIMEGIMAGMGIMEGQLADKLRMSVGNPIVTVGNSLSTFGRINAPALSAVGSTGGSINIEVTINDPVVREDADLERLAKKVGDELAKRLREKQRYGGQTMF